MTPGEIERTCEKIKHHLAAAQRHKKAGDHDRMRAEAETAAALFEPVLKAGDPLRRFESLRAAFLSLGYSEEECQALLPSPRPLAGMKKSKKGGTARMAETTKRQSQSATESRNVPDAPDFFQQEDEAALREQAQWLDEKLGLDSRFLSKVLHEDEGKIKNWKQEHGHLPTDSEEILSGLWRVVMHLLSHYNNEEQRVRQLLEQRLPASLPTPPETFPTQAVSPLYPPWLGFPSLKSYLEEHGVNAINQVDKWIMLLRFGDPYSTTSEEATWP